MKETKFTKGPWGLQRCEGGGLLLLRGEGAGKHPQYSVQIVPKEDAHLMAAAPELYEAWREFFEHRSRVFNAQISGSLKEIPSNAVDIILAKAQAAMKKAEGSL